MFERRPSLLGRSYQDRPYLALYGRLPFWSGVSAAPYSMVVHYLDDYRNMKSFVMTVHFLFIYFSVMALGILLRIDCVVAAVTPLSATCLVSTGRSASFPVSVFSVFPHFPRQKPLISFGFSFFHFSIVCAVVLSYAYFAPQLLSFLPNFQVRPPHFTLFFPFQFSLAFVSLEFFFPFCTGFSSH